MAGAGFRVFVDGDVLTAAQMNTYVMEQTIMVFASETTRDAAITSPTDGMFAYTTTTPADTLAYYNGSSWVAVDLSGDITGITTAANSSLAGGATSGAPSLSADVNNTTSATATASDYVLIEDVDDSNATKKALISDITALVPQGDLTGLTAGALIDITAATGPVPTIDVDLSEATTSTSDADGDFFIVTDAASAQHKLTKANIALSGFNNDSGFGVGDITAVVAGTNIGGGATSGSATVDLSIDAEVACADQLLTRPMLKDYSELTKDTAASGATTTIDLEDGNVHTVLMTADCTFTFSNPIADDDCSSFTLILTQDGTGSWEATWPASVDWPGGSAPTLTTTATTGRDMLMFVTVDGGVVWLGSSLLDFS